MEQSIQNQAKFSRMKELGEKTGVLAGLDLPLVGRGLKQGPDPHIRAIV